MNENSNPYVQENEDGSTTILLRYPIERKDGSSLSEITLKPATVGDLEASDAAKGDVQKTVMIVASLSSVPVALIRKISMRDFRNISQQLEKELGEEKKSLATGEQ